MSEQVVVAFQNTHDYPISISVRVGGKPFKFTLWRDEQFKTREGNPVIPDKAEWARLLRLGIKPVYRDVESMQESENSMPHVETILDDAVLLAAKELAAKVPPKAEEFVDEQVQLPEIVEKIKPVNHLDRKDNPNSAKADLVWQDGDGVWIFNKDGKQNLNPAKIKTHIKKTFGEDYLQTVEWVQFGSKIEAASST